MKVFVTGASGWIGSATVGELLAAGHDVVGLARSEASAAALVARGARVLRGDLDDLTALRRGAEEAEGVVHLANKHDFADPTVSDRAERAAVETLAGALVGSGRPLVIAAGAAGLVQGRPATESDPNTGVGPDAPRGGAENLALDHVAHGVRAVSARFAPTVHGVGDHGFLAVIAAAARRAGISGYVGDGSNAWCAVHRSDAARLVRLGLEQAPAGTRMHVVAEEGVTTRDIAEALGRALDLPVGSITSEEAADRLGPFIGGFFGADARASSERTRALLGWTPTGPTLLEDIEAGAYTEA